jgi:hypothetical protein
MLSIAQSHSEDILADFAHQRRQPLSVIALACYLDLIATPDDARVSDPMGLIHGESPAATTFFATACPHCAPLYSTVAPHRSMTQGVLAKYFANLTNIEQHVVIDRIYASCSIRSSSLTLPPASVRVRLEGRRRFYRCCMLQGVECMRWACTLCPQLSLDLVDLGRTCPLTHTWRAGPKSFILDREFSACFDAIRSVFLNS